MTQRKGRTLREVENWLLAHKDWLSSDLPGWLLKLVSGSEYETGLLDLALRRLYLEKHSEEGGSRTYEDTDDMLSAMYSYISRVRSIMELEKIRRASSSFRYRPVRIFSFEEPSITVLSKDDEAADLTIEEILQEKRR